MENKKTVFTLIFCLVLVLIGTFINKFVFGSDTEVQDKGKNYNELVSRGYTEVNLEDNIEFNKGYIVLSKDDENYIDNDKELYIEAINGMATFKYLDSNYEIDINSVIDYYIYTNKEVFYVYLLTSDNKVYFSYYRYEKNEEVENIVLNLNKNFSIIKTDKKIVSFKKIKTHYVNPNGSIYEILVGEDINNVEYFIINGTIFKEVVDHNYYDIVYHFDYNIYVQNDNTLIIDNTDSLFKVKYILKDYFVSNDNYLYKVSNGNISKEYNMKVKYMFYYKYGNVLKLGIIFEDDFAKHLDLFIKDFNYEIQGILIEDENS